MRGEIDFLVEKFLREIDNVIHRIYRLLSLTAGELIDAKTEYVAVGGGEGEPVFRLEIVFPTQEEAKEFVKSIEEEFKEKSEGIVIPDRKDKWVDIEIQPKDESFRWQFFPE